MNIKLLFSILILSFFIHASTVFSVVTPSLSFTASGNNTAQVLVTAAPNAQVQLYYTSANGNAMSTTLGTTDSNGSLSTSINATTYTIPASASLYITVAGVQSGNASWPYLSSNTSNSVGLSQTNVALLVGQVKTITTSAQNGLSIASNSNSSVASAFVTGGNQISVTALAVGTTNVSVCATGYVCTTVYITITSGGTSNALSIGKSSLDITSGESKTLDITGSGGYLVSTNSNPTSVTAFVNGNNLLIQGGTPGGANLSICQSSGQCVPLYVYVVADQKQVTSVYPVALSSLNVSSSNFNNTFMGAKSAVTVAFKVNQPISSPTITIAGTKKVAEGTGNGPYSVVYSATGNESNPVSISIGFVDAQNVSGQISLVLQNPSGVVGAVSAPVIVSDQSGATVQTFNLALNVGSTGDEVTKLQKLLTKLGFYAGPITGKFGALTESSVKQYQAKKGIKQLGNVGPATRTSLNKE